MIFLKFGGEAIVTGENAVEFLGSVDAKRAFIVTTGTIARKLGQVDAIEKVLSKNNIESVCFEDVEPDPEIENVLCGAKQMLAFRPDLIIALGGGSAIDSAKAMWVAYEYPEFDSLEKFMQPNILPKIRQKARLIAIPTTSGTGSEVTRSVVLSDKKSMTKQAFRDNQLVPDYAILDPAFTQSMPPLLTAATGMDALTHAIEAYVTSFANDFSDVLAEKSTNQIFEYLPKAYQDPSNLLYRSKMQNYASMAGMAFASAYLGVTHSIAHAFGAIFHVPHGLANAITLPYVIQFNRTRSDFAETRYTQLEQQCGFPDIALAITELQKMINIPDKMQQVLPDEALFLENLGNLTQHALADSCTKTNPVLPTEQEMTSLIKQVYYG